MLEEEREGILQVSRVSRVRVLRESESIERVRASAEWEYRESEGIERVRVSREWGYRERETGTAAMHRSTSKVEDTETPYHLREAFA